MLSMQRETTEYIYIGINGDVPTNDVEFAFLDAGQRPSESDWHTAVKISDEEHSLWDAADSSTSRGEWFAALLIGEFGNTGLELDPGAYQVWVRFTDDIERPVRIVPTTLEVA